MNVWNLGDDAGMMCSGINWGICDGNQICFYMAGDFITGICLAVGGEQKTEKSSKETAMEICCIWIYGCHFFNRSNDFSQQHFRSMT
jgi:hypothetical protein